MKSLDHQFRPAVRWATASLLASVALASTSGALADPLATPSMTAPLSANANPFSVDGGPLGKIYVGGALTGMAMVQDNRLPTDKDSRLDITNAQVIVQNTSGPLQFYVQAGTYSQPFLGVPYIKSSDATKLNFGNVPIAYIKVQATPELSFQAGKLFPLIGDEYTFSFQNMNVFRGLLVAQEPAVSQGFQANYAKGPIALAVSLNDGFYSGKLNWVTGSATYTFSPSDTVVLSGGGNVGKTSTATFATPPAQNNGAIVDLIWTHTSGPWMISPYLQYTKNSAHDEFGVFRDSSTWGAAVLAKYAFTPKFSLAGRAEYEKSHSDGCDATDPVCVPTNVLFGPSSDAWSFTATPTYQMGIYFLRAEVSYVHAGNITPGFGFGDSGTSNSQTRGLVEAGVIF